MLRNYIFKKYLKYLVYNRFIDKKRHYIFKNSIKKHYGGQFQLTNTNQTGSLVLITALDLESEDLVSNLQLTSIIFMPEVLEMMWVYCLLQNWYARVTANVTTVPVPVIL